MKTSNDAFKAIADPARRQILHLLRRGEMTAGDLAQHFDMTKSTMSHHFAVLAEADLIMRRREGQTIWYALNTTVLEDVIAWAMDLAGRSGERGNT
jgi:DNA-binding transcriptional ArsR family regulator